MFVIINALKSITRSKGRNILVGIIVLAIAASSCVALAIRNAANESEAAGIDLINITGSITVDRQKLRESMEGSGSDGMQNMRELMSQYQGLSLAELLTYSESDYVKDFYYSSSISLNATGELEAYSTESNSSDSADSNNNFAGGQGRPGGMMRGGFAMGDFTITGYSAEDAMTKFMDGTAQITDGEMFDLDSSDMECLISSELAAFNGLVAGDKIKLVNPNTEDETYEFTITGIYTDSSSGETGDQIRFSTSMDPANLICTSYGSLKSVLDQSESVATVETNEYGMEESSALSGQLASTYVFSSQENFDNFGTELKAKGLSEYYTVSSSDINNYESSLLPLKNLSKFATTLLIIVLSIGAVILIVINVFNIRERKYEVGVLTAMGIKKGKVAMQFVAELLFVTLLAIIVGTGVGAVVSIPVSNDLLSSQIEQMEAQAENPNMNLGRPDGGGARNFQGGGGGMGRSNMGGPMMSMFGSDAPTDVNYLDKINATVNFSILGQLIGIGIILTLISSFAAVVFVMRYEPLKILANRA